MLNCHDITRLISESQERSLSVKEKMALKMHVMMCSGCRNFGRQMFTIRNVARAYTRGEDVQADETKD